MVMLRSKKTKRSKRALILAIVMVGIVAVAGGIMLWQHHKPSKPTVANKPIALPSTVNYGPPTQAEKQESQQNKDSIVQEQQSPTPVPSPTNPKSVTPVITRVTQSGDTVSVAAYIAGVVESTGSCQLQATHAGSAPVQQTSAGFSDATTTDCTVFSIPRSQFGAAGAWTFTVSYTSPDAQGTSQTVTQTLQ